MPLGSGFDLSLPLFGILNECGWDSDPDVKYGALGCYGSLFDCGIEQDLIHDDENAWLKHGGRGVERRT
jgi:hypothetical protein